MRLAIKNINTRGIQEIHAFLSERHKRGGGHFTLSMLRAWVADAEFQLGEGNTATIEINSWDTVSGHTETFTVSAAGIDTVNVDDDA